MIKNLLLAALSTAKVGNILTIVWGQLRDYYLSCYESSKLYTWHKNFLAVKGTRFTHVNELLSISPLISVVSLYCSRLPAFPARLWLIVRHDDLLSVDY